MNNPIFFINVTRECNVDCPRCYLSEKKRKTKECIDDAFIEKTLQSSIIKDWSLPSVWIWEGGELSIVGEKKMRHFCEMVRKAAPHVNQTMVTNALSMPDWLINLSKEYFNSRFETTYALGEKFTLNGSSDRYQEKFKKSVKKAIDAGINVTVNVELNRETFAAGTNCLVDVMLETNVKIWEFDVSVAFDKFLKSPVLNSYQYPEVETTTTYTEFYDYLIELISVHEETLQRAGIQSSIFWQAETKSESQFFAVKRAQDMITINPDGSVTINVLWSDIPALFIGNLKVSSLDKMLASPIRRNHIRWEGVIRAKSCIDCRHYEYCRGGPSHLPLYDGVSDECAGGKKLWDFMEAYDGKYSAMDHQFDPSEV